jgi:hypothetical protein
MSIEIKKMKFKKFAFRILRDTLYGTHAIDFERVEGGY